MSQHYTWLKPRPLWQEDGDDYRQPDFFQPHLFRYNSDAFVEEFMAAAQAADASTLAGRLAQPSEAGAAAQAVPADPWQLLSGERVAVLPGARFSPARRRAWPTRRAPSSCCAS
ncbi:MAG: hypothetical protein V9H69_24815 [Anaerolineae bacterium]